MSDDLIKRQDEIDAIECVTWYHQNRNKDMVSGANDEEEQAWYKAEDIYKAIDGMPTVGKIGEIYVDVQRLAKVASDFNVKIDFEVKVDGGCEVWIEPMKGADDEFEAKD